MMKAQFMSLWDGLETGTDIQVPYDPLMITLWSPHDQLELDLIARLMSFYLGQYPKLTGN